MQISYQTFPDKPEYQSLLVINDQERWNETLYFTFYHPWGEEQERLFAGRSMSGFHFKKKPCTCVFAFDFHRWDAATLDRALALELPPVDFATPLKELLEKALSQREGQPEGFTFKIKG